MPDFSIEPIPPRVVGCKRSIRLKTAGDVSRFMGKLVNGVLRGEIDPAEARTVGYLVSILLNSLEQSNLEERISNIERMIDEKH